MSMQDPPQVTWVGYPNSGYPVTYPMIVNPSTTGVDWKLTNVGKNADVIPFQAEPTGRAFKARLAPEGIPSSDGRMFAAGAIWTRRPPLPLMFLNRTTNGHNDAVLVGNILRVWREGEWIMASGVFDSTPEAREALRLVQEGRLNRISVDTVITEVDIPEDDELDFIATRAELLGATIVPFAAFGDAMIELDADTNEADIEVAPLLASLHTTGDIPPNAFNIAEGDKPIPVTIDPEGRIYGHLALWNTCHQGIKDTCVIAPKSKTNYAHFLIGNMDGRRVGVITLDTVHASPVLDRNATVRHYADTGTIAAYVTITDGKLGPWLNGFVEPSLTEAQLRRFKAVGISGDWRYDASTQNMELVAILAVPTPGFRVPRFEHEGNEIAMVASLGPESFEAVEDCIGCQESEAAAEDVADTLAEAEAVAEEILPTVEETEDEPEDTEPLAEIEPEPAEEIPVTLDTNDDDDDDDDIADAELAQLLDEAIDAIERQEIDRILTQTG